MNSNPRLHHYCQNIKEGYIDDVVEMYKILGLKITYIPPTKDWIMIGQNGLKFAIQVAQANDFSVEDIDVKSRNHIGFISENPQKIINKIKKWADNKGFRFRAGEWSDIEKFFDLPDIFIDFVVEVMHTSIEKK